MSFLSLSLQAKVFNPEATMSDSLSSAPSVDPENADVLLQTPLHDLHLELGARMVPFAGYSMPVQYADGILKEHQHTRAAAGLFDVSHMGQVRLHGKQAAAELEKLVPIDVVDLPLNQQRYALFTNAQGGILDDLMVTNAGDHLLLVVNAACKHADIAHLRHHLPDCVQVEPLPDQALLALQGPQARAALSRLAPAAAKLVFMQTAAIAIAGFPCWVSCSGYTGEDGYEISVAAEHADALARVLLKQPEVKAIGLGARDSLRLEAGLCLYGHDIDMSTSPVEASLLWSISAVRRPGGVRAGGYAGAAIIEQQINAGAERQRVLLRPEGRQPVREGAEIINEEDAVVGRVTSGGFGPSVSAPVAMGYVQRFALNGPLFAQVRGKSIPLSVQRGAFVASRYVRA
jgi:aminomethyltransferase